MSERAQLSVESLALLVDAAWEYGRAEGEREGREKERAAIAGWLDGVPGLRGQVARTVNTLTGQIVEGDHRQGGEHD